MIDAETRRTSPATTPGIRTRLGVAISASVIVILLLVLAIVDFATSTGSNYCVDGPDESFCGAFSRWTRWDAIAVIGALAVVAVAAITITVGMLKKARRYR